MKRTTTSTKTAVSHELKFAVAGCLCLANSFATQAANPSPTYTRAPMGAYNFNMQDPLLGNSYEKPVWDLHDTLGLPEWLSVGVEHRTRYESLADSFKGSAGTTAQQNLKVVIRLASSVVTISTAALILMPAGTICSKVILLKQLKQPMQRVSQRQGLTQTISMLKVNSDSKPVVPITKIAWGI